MTKPKTSQHRRIAAFVAIAALSAAGCGGSSEDAAPQTTAAATATTSTTEVATTTTLPPEPELNPGALEPATFIALGTADEIDLVRYLGAGADGVWVSVRGNDDNGQPSRAVLLDPEAEVVLLDVAVSGRAGPVAVSESAGWFANGVTNTVSRVDAASGEVVEIADARCVAADATTVWTGDFLSAYRVDEATGQPTGDAATISIDITGAAEGSMDPAFEAYMTDAATDGAAHGCSAQMIVAGGHLWIPSASGPSLAQFDATSGQMLAFHGLGELGQARALVGVDGGVWVFAQSDDSGAIVTSAWLVSDDGTIAVQRELGFMSGWTGQAFAADGFVVIETTEGPADGTGTKNVYLLDPATADLVGQTSTELVHTAGVAAAEGKLFFSTDSPYGVQVFE